jgi:hypothetical protein
MSWYLHACPGCGGALYDSFEEPDWVACLACGRQYKKVHPGQASLHRMNPTESHSEASARRVRSTPKIEELERAA